MSRWTRILKFVFINPEANWHKACLLNNNSNQYKISHQWVMKHSAQYIPSLQEYTSGIDEELRYILTSIGTSINIYYFKWLFIKKWIITYEFCNRKWFSNAPNSRIQNYSSSSLVVFELYLENYPNWNLFFIDWKLIFL